MKEWFVDCYLSTDEASVHSKHPVNSYGPNTLEECFRIVRVLINEDDTTEKSGIVKVEITKETKGCSPIQDLPS